MLAGLRPRGFAPRLAFRPYRAPRQDRRVASSLARFACTRTSRRGRPGPCCRPWGKHYCQLYAASWDCHQPRPCRRLSSGSAPTRHRQHFRALLRRYPRLSRSTGPRLRTGTPDTNRHRNDRPDDRHSHGSTNHVPLGAYSDGAVGHLYAETGRRRLDTGCDRTGTHAGRRSYDMATLRSSRRRYDAGNDDDDDDRRAAKACRPSHVAGAEHQRHDRCRRRHRAPKLPQDNGAPTRSNAAEAGRPAHAGGAKPALSNTADVELCRAPHQRVRAHPRRPRSDHHRRATHRRQFGGGRRRRGHRRSLATPQAAKRAAQPQPKPMPPEGTTLPRPTPLRAHAAARRRARRLRHLRRPDSGDRAPR